MKFIPKMKSNSQSERQNANRARKDAARRSSKNKRAIRAFVRKQEETGE